MKSLKVPDLNEIDSAYEVEISTILIKRKLARNDVLCVSNTKACHEVFKQIFDRLDDDQEHLVMLILGNDLSIIGYKTVFSGTLKSSLVDIGVLARQIFLFGSERVLLAHNHPSSDIFPSDSDVNITDKINRAFKIMGIELLDHIILNGNKYLSMKTIGYF